MAVDVQNLKFIIGITDARKDKIQCHSNDIIALLFITILVGFTHLKVTAIQK